MSLLKKIGNYIWSLNFLKHLLIIAVIYVVIIFGVIYFLESTTRHGQQVKVPDLKGKNVNTIASLVQSEGLDYEVLDSVYMPELALGTIVSQDPEPTSVSGVFVKEGRVIRVRVSKRTELVEVPALVDKSQRFAENILESRGFKYKTEFKATTESHGAVISQRYKGKAVKVGDKLPIGSLIILTVGRNELSIPVDLPNLVGSTINDARSTLASWPSIQLYITCEDCMTSADTAIARVMHQTPEYIEGAQIPSGGTITVFASKNPPAPEMPE